MKNIVVLVSGGGTNLQALIDAEKRGEIKGGKITCVIASKADAYALTRATDNGIKTRVLVRRDFPDVKSYSKAMRDALVEEKADLVVYAGFMTILDEQVCDAFPNRMINIHPALIPSFCGKGFYGLHVHEAALAKGVKVSGATVHFVTADCDAGPIILQKAVEVKNGDTPETLQKRIMEEAEWKILPQAVSLFCEDRIIVKNGVTEIKMSRVVINGESADYFNTIEGVLYSSRFGAEVMLYGKNVSEEYLTRCADYFDTLPGEISEKLRQATAAYLNDMLEEHAGEFAFDVIEFNAQNVAPFIVPVELHTQSFRLLSEEDSPAAFSVKFAFSPVADQYIEWTVRGEQAVYAGEYIGVSPWDEKILRRSWNYVGEG